MQRNAESDFSLRFDSRSERKYLLQQTHTRFLIGLTRNPRANTHTQLLHFYLCEDQFVSDSSLTCPVFCFEKQIRKQNIEMYI